MWRAGKASTPRVSGGEKQGPSLLSRLLELGHSMRVTPASVGLSRVWSETDSWMHAAGVNRVLKWIMRQCV